MYDYEGHYDQVEVYMSIVSVVETIGKKEKVISLLIMTNVRYSLQQMTWIFQGHLLAEFSSGLIP
jgi:hypothetical protein